MTSEIYLELLWKIYRGAKWHNVRVLLSVNVGLKQGCIISPWLFNLYISDYNEEIENLVLGYQQMKIQ